MKNGWKPDKFDLQILFACCVIMLIVIMEALSIHVGGK